MIDSTSSPTAVDFEKNEVLIVSFGPLSGGCVHQIPYVQRIENLERIRLVDLNPDIALSVEGPCQLVTNALDLVVFPRAKKPLEFVIDSSGPDAFIQNQTWRPIPPTAPWMARPSLEAALDTATEGQQAVTKEIARRLIPSDSTTPLRDLRLLAQSLQREWDHKLAERLFVIPAVTADRDALMPIAAYGPRPYEPNAFRLFALQRFGLQVAEDRKSPFEWLRAMVLELGQPETRAWGQPDYTKVAEALARNDAIYRSQELLRITTYNLQWYPIAKETACNAFRARYSLVDTLSVDPFVTSFTVNCPPFPPN